jgi:hypothetical protein
MSLLKRRHFIQFAGSTLAAMGLSQVDFFQQAEQYGRVLAQSTPRKLALLVGINSYDAVTPLNGCLTDVELQQHLLIHRFGFNPNDIMIVADNAKFKPTRENIIQAFESHLIAQAKPGDVVVFHFSGHGSLVKDPFPLNLAECQQENSINNSCQYNGTILPQDAESIKSDNPEIPVSHIMGQTLFLLKNRVKTDKFTMILDSCHSGGGTRGNIVVRAARLTRNSQILIPSETELEFQQQQLSKLGWSEDELMKRRQAGIAKGVALGSAGRTQEAIDADFGTFHAGAFTYLLTRYLWQLTSTQTAESVYINLRRSTNSLARSKNHTTAQIPTFEYQPGSNFNQQSLFFLELQTPSAEAVITTVRGETIEFWLGGVASQNLKGSGEGFVYSVLDDSGEVVAEIEQTSRVEGEGLIGRGKQISGEASAIQEGRLLREQIVGIPANPQLQLALDESLGADLTTANTELKSNKRIELVNRNKLTESGYFLGRFTEEYQQQQAEINPDMKLPPVSCIGLFQADLTPDIASFGRLEEPIINAINRLQPRLRRLLANQILGQLLNAGQGSPLEVKAEVSGGGQVLEVGSRGLDESKAANIPVQFRSGTQLQIKVSNESNQNLYLAILLISAQGDIDPFHPTNWDAPEEESLFAASEAVELPRQGESTLEVTGKSGFPEIMILASQEPLRNTLKALQQIAASRGKSRGRLGGLRGEESLGIIDSLLTDVARSGSSENGGFQQRTISYETSTMAVLSAVLEVVG